VEVPPRHIWAFLEWIKVEVIGAAASFAFPDTVPRARGADWPCKRRRERGRRSRGGEEGRAAGACSRWGAVALPPPPPREREGGAVFFLFPRKKDRSSSEESNSGFGELASGPGAGVGDAALQTKEGGQTSSDLDE